MTVEIIVTIVAGLLLAVAAVGTVYPVLPGSLLAIATLIGWAWVMGSRAAWIAAGIGSLLAGVGLAAAAVPTGRKLKQQELVTAHDSKSV
jgi:uncharacterized protein